MIVSNRNPYIHADEFTISAPGFIHRLQDGASYTVQLEQGSSGNWNIWIRECVEFCWVINFSGQIVVESETVGKQIVEQLLELENYHAV